MSKALDNDNMGTLCLNFLKFFDGLKPTIKLGEFGFLKNCIFFQVQLFRF